jgi:hypothetical protein
MMFSKADARRNTLTVAAERVFATEISNGEALDILSAAGCTP